MAKNKAAKTAKKLQKEANKAAAKAAATTKVETTATETKDENAGETAQQSITTTQTQATQEKPQAPKPEQKPEPKPEQKPEQKPEEKPDTKPEGKKRGRPRIPILEAEEVNTSLGNSLSSSAASNLANGDRIDRNHGVELMKMIHQEYVTNTDSPEELRKAMKCQFDAMAFVHLAHWNEQTKEELGNAGVKVSKEMFDAMSVSIAESLGLTLKGLPSKDGQMEIDFEGTMKDAPEETKEVIETEKRVKPVKEVPVWNKDKTDEEVIADLRSIMSMKNGMENNLYNAVEYARKAFSMEKVEPAFIIANILTNLQTPHVLMNSFRGMAYGSLVKTSAPYAMHCRFVQKLRGFKYTEKEIANIIRVFISDMIKVNAKDNKKQEEENLSAYSALLNAYNDKFIQQIMNGAKDTSKPVKLDVKGLLCDPLDCVAIVNIIKETYGESLSEKLVKQKLSEIGMLYASEPLNPLASYVEKGYAAAK